jgi:hypothetical protein
VSRDGVLVVLRAGVRGQCARARFYRDDRLEDWLGTLETRHAPVYRSVVAISAGEREDGLRTAEERTLREAMLVQRARTPRNALVQAQSIDAAMLSTYAEYLGQQPSTTERNAIIRAIREGRAHLRGSETRSLLQSLRYATMALDVIADLRLLILRNLTDVPFVIGDTPCLSSNHYMREVEGFGVLGFAQRGIMLSMPLDSKTHVLLMDGAVYRAAAYEKDVVDVAEERDVVSLNELQLYGALENIYFAHSEDDIRVQEFVGDRPAGPADHRGGFRMLTPGGRLPDSVDQRPELMVMYEPQLPTTLDLSFITTRPMPPNADITIARRPRLIEHLEELHHVSRGAGPLGIDELVDVVESQLVVTEET